MCGHTMIFHYFYKKEIFCDILFDFFGDESVLNEVSQSIEFAP